MVKHHKKKWCDVHHGLSRVGIPGASTIWYKFLICCIDFFIACLHLSLSLIIPPKGSKKVVASAGRAAQGRASQRKNISPEVVDSDSGDKFKHLAVEAEDRYTLSIFSYSSVLTCFYFLDSIDKVEVVEISNNESGGEGGEKPVPVPASRMHRNAPTKPPSTPLPVKAACVLFCLFCISYLALYHQWKKT